MTSRQLIVAALVATVALAGSIPGFADEQSTGARSFKPPPETSFSLIDHRGQRVSDADFRGKFLLVYFGYTYCPDICPTDLQTMSEAVDTLDAAGVNVQPIFITVDPERDTAGHFADYVEAFHPRLIGLTGSPDEIARTAKGYRARYFKLHYPVENDSDDENGEATTAMYTVRHTGFTYLVGPNGRGLMTFPRGERPDDLAREAVRLVNGKSG